MTLFDLKQGEKAKIKKVNGQGSFRKRIIEMGFISGKEVEVIKKAPLKDPIEYKIMDYYVSLRNDEAKLIEVNKSIDGDKKEEVEFSGIIDLNTLKRSNKFEDENTINIAFVGNPNSGKTTIFNSMSGMSERVGNYSGVTVGAKFAQIKHRGYKINIIDLPGTYSITAYSPEELFVRKFIIDHQPDIVINVLDAGNLERNLYLTTQLIDMDIKVVAALNMHDELEKKGALLDEKELSIMLGIPFVPTIGNRKKGIDKLLDKAVDVFEDKDEVVRHIHINYGKLLEKQVEELEKTIESDKNVGKLSISPRFLAIKILEKDKDALKRVMSLKGAKKILALRDEFVEQLEKTYKTDCETIITDAKYAFIAGALHQVYKPGKEQKKRKSQIIDGLLTHRIWGIPIFLFFMWLTFWSTFTLGEYPMQWIEMGVDALGTLINQHMQEGVLKDLIINGLIGGVGGVLVFIPNIVILYFFVSIMEDTGYMARAVFIMDRAMHKIGLHGKSFIPLLMGFGCNVPAITATRTIESKRDRIITMLITPFMSCSARLPVYILFITAFFQSHQATILFSLYLFGVIMAILTSLILTKTVFKKADLPFVMELPPYRKPTLRSLIKHMWTSAEQYLKKIGGVILIASIIIWVLGYFPRDKEIIEKYDREIEIVSQQNLSQVELSEKISMIEREKEGDLQEQSYIGRIGHFIQPVFSPMNFDWKLSVGIITGVAAKEVVVGTLGVLYKAGDEEETGLLIQKLQNQRYTSGENIGKPIITPLVALSYMFFVLIYFPCIAVVAAVQKESGHWKYALFITIYTTVMAWIVSFLVYQIGNLFI